MWEPGGVRGPKWLSFPCVEAPVWAGGGLGQEAGGPEAVGLLSTTWVFPKQGTHPHPSHPSAVHQLPAPLQVYRRLQNGVLQIQGG